MRFIDDDPMWPARLCAELLNSREQAHEHGRTICERDTEQVDADRVLHGIQDFENFGDARHLLRATERDESFEFVVVAFGIKQTDLVFLLHQTFDDCGYGSGLP